jgi:hypothetical protein
MDGTFDGGAPGARNGGADEATVARYRADPRRAVSEDRIVCLVCGAAFRQLTNTHVATHAMTPLDYKRAYGYNRRRPLMCHALRRLYSTRAVRVRLADRIRRRPIVADPELRRRAVARTVPLEEILTRRDIQRQPRRRWSTRDPQGRFLARAAQG